MEDNFKKTFWHFPSGIAHCLFWFQRTSCNLSGEEIMAYHFVEETDATIQLSVVSVFLVPENDPVGIVQGF